MPSIKSLWASVRHFTRNLLRRKSVERDLTEEIERYADLLIDEKLAQGMSPDEARRATQMEIGDVELVKDHVRDVRMGAWIDLLRQDVRFAFGTLIRRPAFTTTAVLTLSVGIGATTAIFSLIDGVLLKPLPFRDPDRLALVWEVRPRFNQPRMEASPPNYLDWQQQVHSFESLAAYRGGFVNLTGAGTPERLAFTEVTPNLFSTLGVEPILGRWFAAPEGSPGHTTVAILSYGLWLDRFAGDRSIVGQTIRLDGAPHLVVGVMPRGFQFPREGIQVWTPMEYRAGTSPQARGNFFLSVLGRLRPDVSMEEANTELRTVADRLAQTYRENIDSSAFAVPLQQDLARNARASFLLLLAASGLVLLIACANVAGLLLTRSTERDREFAVRTALGGSRVQLLRQLLVEGLLLSTIGAVIGILLATRTFAVLETLIPDSMRGAVAPTLDLRLLTVALVAVVITGLVFGLLPLRQALKLDQRTRLNSRTASAGRRRAQAVLVAGEVALGVVVLFSTGLMIRTVLNLQAVDPGFRPENVLTANIQLSGPEYATPESHSAFFRDVLDRVGALPGVTSAGFTTFLPYTVLIGAGPVTVEGRARPGDGSDIAIIRYVTPEYLNTLGVPLLRGRGLSDQDTSASPGVILVSERVSNLFGGDPVGKQIVVAFGAKLTVVGVVGDIKGEGIETPNTRGVVYLPAAQLSAIGFFSPRALAIRTTSNPAALTAAVQREIWAINPNQTIANVQTLQSIVEGQLADRKVQTGLFTSFAGLALFMAALGVYGLMSFVVSTRSRELGLRTALGAQRRDLVSLIAGDSAVWVGFGLVAGLGLAVIVSRSMRSLIFGVEALDWVSLITAICILGAVAVVAALAPVWRATRVDAMTVLRAE